MSFKAPKPPRVSSRSSSLSRRPSSLLSKDTTIPRTSHHLIPPSDASKTRGDHGTKGRDQSHYNKVLAEPFGRVFVQEPAPLRKSTAAAVHPAEPQAALDDSFADTGDAEVAEPFPIYVLAGGKDPDLRQQCQQRKKERQWAKWENEIIPSLLQPYLRILRESDNLRTLNHHSSVALPTCLCERRTRIDVTCVFFERKLFYFCSIFV
jgi:hypothetical protein